MAKKYVIIHGHFYQPPRENAWLEEILEQPSAAPFSNWNERINYECYAPNRASRILNHQGRIIQIVNNFESISFNIGPTLMSWIEKYDAYTYQKIIDADRVSRLKYDGHGNAIAQAYNHTILPLCNTHDKYTQVRWGIYDFHHRFGRLPEGMWMPETAMDVPTLEVLAEEGIKFTICAPRQALLIRKLNDEAWQSVNESTLDTTRPYLVNLPSGRQITIFFYHGALSQAVAFEGVLNDGHVLAKRLAETTTDGDIPGLIHIATDGESYGHHHRYGEMALSACIESLEKMPDVEITNYSHYLQLYPPTAEVQIQHVSSWSCYHGVGRWKEDCGCQTGEHPGWHQKYREPLRNTLDWLRDNLIDVFQREGTQLFKDLWRARDEYIAVILNRNRNYVYAFLNQHLLPDRINDQESCVKALRLLEIQRQCMLFYTSCGWFFDDIAGVESIQVLQYACRSLKLAQYLGYDFNTTFETLLEQIPVNNPEDINGLHLYKTKVLTEEVQLENVALHIAVAALFENIEPEKKLYNSIIHSIIKERWYRDEKIFATGHIKINSAITWAELEFSFGALYRGQDDIKGYIKTGQMNSRFEEFVTVSQSLFHQGEDSQLETYLRQHLGAQSIHFDDLFKNEKLKVLRFLSKKYMKALVAQITSIYETNQPILEAMSKNGFPVAGGFLSVIGFSLNSRLIDILSTHPLEMDSLLGLREEFVHWKVTIEDPDQVAMLIERVLFRQLRQFELDPSQTTSLEHVIRILQWTYQLDIPLNMWKSQNELSDLLSKNHFSEGAAIKIEHIKSLLGFESNYEVLH